MMKTRTKVTAGAVTLAAVITGALLLQPEKLPQYVYEGETVLGYDIPPRLYAYVEQHAERDRIRLGTPECKPDWFNWPCHVVIPRSDQTVRLHVFHCVDFRTAAKFDHESCKNQRDYDASFK